MTSRHTLCHSVFIYSASIDWVPTLQSWTTLNVEPEDLKVLNKGLEGDCLGSWYICPVRNSYLTILIPTWSAKFLTSALKCIHLLSEKSEVGGRRLGRKSEPGELRGDGSIYSFLHSGGEGGAQLFAGLGLREVSLAGVHTPACSCSHWAHSSRQLQGVWCLVRLLFGSQSAAY